MKKLFGFALSVGLSCVTAVNAEWQIMTSPSTAELRGLSAVDDKVVWASGAKSTIMRSIDGAHWAVLNAPNGDWDFRDIEAFSHDEAIVMSAGPGAASSLWLTQNGGQTWQSLFHNKEEKGFWDAIAFSDREHGVLLGDPVAGRFQLWTTQDAGKNWQRSPADGMPLALEGEGAFAASGTCVSVYNNDRVAFVSGGAERARVFVSVDKAQHFSVSDLPIPVSASSQGAFSLAWINEQTLIVVGGDYKQAQLAGINAAISHDAGKTWQSYSAAPSGFLSAIAVQEQNIVLSGLAGSSVGQLNSSFKSISALPLNAIVIKAKTIYAAGPKGNLVKTTLP